MFWIAIALAFSAYLIAEAITKKARMEVLRTAVDKGQPLDPALVDKLMKSDDESASDAVKARNPMRVVTGLQVAAIMVTCIGVALLAMGVLTDKPPKEVFGVGVVLGCISLGLYLSSRLVKSRIPTAGGPTQ